MEDEIAKKLELIQLSNNSIKHRIDRVSQDILEQVVHGLTEISRKFCDSDHESVHIKDNPQLMMFVQNR